MLKRYRRQAHAGTDGSILPIASVPTASGCAQLSSATSDVVLASSTIRFTKAMSFGDGAGGSAVRVTVAFAAGR